MDDRPVMVLIGGINGAGKTTLYYEQIKPALDKSDRSYPFVNADELERARFPNEVGKHSLEMAKVAATIREQYCQTKQSFITETVFSHESKIELILMAQKAGFKVLLHHVHVDSPELAYKRVQNRVHKGGHNVPKDKVLRRYERTLANIHKASLIADQTYVWDNSQSQDHTGVIHKFVMLINSGQIVKITNQLPNWAQTLYSTEIKKYKA